MTQVVEQSRAGKASTSFGPESEASTAEASCEQTVSVLSLLEWTRSKSPEGKICVSLKMPLEFPGDCVLIRLITHRHLDRFRKVLNKSGDKLLNVKQQK